MMLEDRVAVVTGASQGIGEAIAGVLAKDGARVACVDVQREKLEAVVERLRAAGGRASAHPADVTKLADAERVVADVLAAEGRVDLLVNNAGITRDGLLMRLKEEDWDAVLAVNLKGTFNFCKAVVRPMLSARSGRIVNIASVAGCMGNAGQTNYAASKGAVISFSKSLAREVASRGITVNCVAPGYIQTAMTESLPEDIKTAFLGIIPAKRFGLPLEVAFAVKFLLSDEAAYITGQTIGVNGGMYM